MNENSRPLVDFSVVRRKTTQPAHTDCMEASLHNANCALILDKLNEDLKKMPKIEDMLKEVEVLRIKNIEAKKREIL